MNIESQETQTKKQSGNFASFLAGVFIGGLIGAGTALLTAPQAGSRTRAELQQGVEQLRDRTSETVKDTVTQVKSRANEIKSEVQIKAGEIQHQGKKLITRQLDRVSQMADAGKKAIENNADHVVA